MSKFFKEFRDFAVKGNVVDMAVGIVIGGAFGKIVSSLVGDIIMPVIGAICGGVNFTSLKFVLREAVLDPNTQAIVKPAVAISYGNFIQVCIDFIIIAFSIFLVVKAINKAKEMKKKEETAAPAPAAKPADVALLEEIRDLLKNQK